MNFEFSEESVMLREEARSFLQDRCGSKAVREMLESDQLYALPVWREMAKMGWQGAAIPEEFGGSGLGYEVLCVIAEELGRVVAPVPFASSIYLASEAILLAGDDHQRRTWIPSLADGSRVSTFALFEGHGRPSRNAISVQADNGKLHGTKWPVPDGTIADFAVIAARDDAGIGLYVVDLAQTSVERRVLKTIDPTRGQAEIRFRGAKAERLARFGTHWPIVVQVLERAAILIAFEQLGGADACLAMARNYAMERSAFGRPIASFQAIKHKLADVYVEIEIARSNAYYGAWALSSREANMGLAAAAARVAAIEAFRLAAKENIQTHGGAGYTWEFDCHLYYRRAKALALAIGGAPYWMDRLVQCLETSPAA
jgi:acyl-CoA dehydrogenase